MKKIPTVYPPNSLPLFPKLNLDAKFQPFMALYSFSLSLTNGQYMYHKVNI
jgi:hypothetical protein